MIAYGTLGNKITFGDETLQAIGRRSFSGLTIMSLAACSAEGSGGTMGCGRYSDGNEAFDCIQSVMFGPVGRGALIGAISGAILGGVVSFALTRNPIPGLIAGAIVGGVAGGIIAYYNYSAKRASYNPDRMMNDISQDSFADARKTRRLGNASVVGRDDIAQILQDHQISTGLVSSVSDHMSNRQAALISLSQTADVYRAMPTKVSETAGGRRAVTGESLEILQSSIMAIKDTAISIADDVRQIREMLSYAINRGGR